MIRRAIRRWLGISESASVSLGDRLADARQAVRYLEQAEHHAAHKLTDGSGVSNHGKGI